MREMKETRTKLAMWDRHDSKTISTLSKTASQKNREMSEERWKESHGVTKIQGSLTSN